MGTHDFIKFPPSYKLGAREWILLGVIQARIEQIIRIPIPAYVSQNFRTIYLSKGVHSTTAIEGNSFSEEEVARIIAGDFQVPPSRDYQRQQITNMVAALNHVAREMAAGDSVTYSLSRLNDWHRLVLDGFGNDTVRVGEIRQHRVTVGRYLAAPPSELERLLDQFCAWLNDAEFAPAGYKMAAQLLKAIAAHVYFAWIHPYGDGNGRMARLIEFAILLEAGVPDIAAHLPSDFYNKTRDEYYRQLQESHGEYRDERYPADGNLAGFIRYALQGLKDELDAQLKVIHDTLQETVWRDSIHAVFRERYSATMSTARQRQRRLLLALTDHGLEKAVRARDIRSLSSELYELYLGKTERTITRDLNQLVDMGLMLRFGNRYRSNSDSLFAFMDPVR